MLAAATTRTQPRPDPANLGHPGAANSRPPAEGRTLTSSLFEAPASTSAPGRDPATGRYAKGAPGRPKGALNKSTLLARELLEDEAPDLVRRLIDLARSGDRVALRLCVTRFLPARRELPVAVELPPIRTSADAVQASANVIAAVVAGTITIDEGLRLARILAMHRRTQAAAEQPRAMSQSAPARATATERQDEGERASDLRVPGDARQRRQIEADLADGAVPLVVDVVAEQQVLVRRRLQPTVGLDLRLELSRRPPGIAERQQAAARSVARRDRGKHVHAGGERNLVANH